jgi:hypothetical protein
MLYASTELTRAELAAEVDTYEIGDWVYGYEQRTLQAIRHTLTAEMKTWVVIQAPDYATAFEALWRSWSPGTAGSRPALTPRRPELAP